MGVDFLRLKDYFRDDEQLWRVQTIVQSRLANDREQEECRYLMRFWWQLSMSYREVTLSELENTVSKEKLSVIEDLLAALEKGHPAIDAWADRCERELPVIEDRGYQMYEIEPLQ